MLVRIQSMSTAVITARSSVVMCARTVAPDPVYAAGAAGWIGVATVALLVV